MRKWIYITAAVAIAIFWTMLSLIFESVVWQHRSGWEFLPWWTCDLIATLGGAATFAFVVMMVRKK
jgi:hypothetical protein